MKRTWRMRKTSVVALAMKAAAHIARDVITAGTANPAKTENNIIADAMARTEAIGKPSMLARMEPKVCSCQVIGSQYGTCEVALTPLR